MTKRPTIKDVASKAGVSIATVSFVLNKHPNEVISERVKRRVWQAARQLNYHPSAAAAGLARKRTRNVAIVFYLDESTISNQFYSFVIQGAVREAMQREYHLLFSYVDTPYRSLADLPKTIRESNAEGVLVIQRIEPRMIRDLVRLGLPVVSVDAFPAMKQLDSLEIDNQRGGFLAGEHLAGLGHRRIAVLQAAADRPSIAERVRGFRAALLEQGVKLSQRSQVLEAKHLTFEAAHARAHQALSRASRPTALFCVNDEMAAGALRAAHELGLRVPHDLSVMGFDDITMSSYTNPPLSTVGVVKDQLGSRAMARLVELVEHGSGKPARETVGVSLVVRGSTAAAPPEAPGAARRR